MTGRNRIGDDVLPEDLLARHLQAWSTPPISFASPEAAERYGASARRVIDALELRQPDRVPVNLNMGFWPASWARMTPCQAMNDPVRAGQAWLDFNLEFPADTMTSPLFHAVSAPMYESLDYRLFTWPGHYLSADSCYQYNEQEWMLPEEYENLIADPTDFLLRTYLPRTVGAFQAFSGLSSLLDFLELPLVPMHMGGWGTPQMRVGLERLLEASRRAETWSSHLLPVVHSLVEMGFPAYYGGATKAPFDILGDTLRGTRGIMLDLFRFPDKVIEACERLVPVAINWAIGRPGGPATPFVFIPLHKGADGFMSSEQFRLFYWPTLRAVVLGLIESGYVPALFAEGRYDSRLEEIADLPAGKTIWYFDRTDMVRAKQTIGQIACIEGNVPLSLMHAGTPQEVTDYCRNLIDNVGSDGGFILNLGAAPDTGREDNLRAMLRSVERG